MCICDSSYPRKLAFSYLDELSKEFQGSYGEKIDSASRSYAFMGFGALFTCAQISTNDIDTFISKTTRLYRDSRTLTQGAGGAPGPSSQLDQLNENLKDVTRIMTKNMEDLLWRGDSLDRRLSFRMASCSQLTTRHVSLVDVFASRVGQIQKGSQEHQPASSVAEMGADWGYRILLYPLHLVEVFLIDPSHLGFLGRPLLSGDNSFVQAVRQPMHNDHP